MPNTIKISPTTELHLESIANGEAKFKEVYQNWETGNIIVVPAASTVEEVTAKYRATV